MKRSYKAAAVVMAALSVGLAAGAWASEPMGGGMGPGMMGGMGHGMMGGMGHGMGKGPMANGPMSQLMTPEERTALMEKMRNAKTPEERQKLAEATHAQMQSRAKEKGITLPEHSGPGNCPHGKMQHS